MDEMTIVSCNNPDLQGVTLLKISGPLTIAQAGSFRDALVAGLATDDEVRLDLAAATEIDVTALQLLCSAHQTAAAAGKVLRVTDRRSGILYGVAEAAGFRRQFGCCRDCMEECMLVTRGAGDV